MDIVSAKLGFLCLTSQVAVAVPGRIFEVGFLSGRENGRVRADRAWNRRGVGFQYLVLTGESRGPVTRA